MKFVGHNFTDDEKELIQRVLRDYFGLKLGDKFVDLNINSNKSLILFLFGTISLIMFIVLQHMNNLSTLKDLVLLLLWFFFWEYADVAWIHRSSIHLERLEAAQLSTAKIVFIDI